MKTLEQYNFKKLFCYYLAMAFALSLCANWTVMDLLLLKMDFDLSRFGLIKGHMFFIPAVTYFLFSNWIKKLHADISVCIWSYFLRCFLPVILPVAALLTHHQTILLWTASGVIAVSWTCAMFANNTLLKLMRTSLSNEKLNSYSLFFNALLGLPGFLISIPAVCFLTRFGESQKAFLIWFTVLQTGTLLCEIPGILALRHLKQHSPLQESSARRAVKVQHIFSRDVLFALAITVLHSLWLGLLSTYFAVFLMRKTGFTPTGIIAIDCSLAIIVLALSRKFGKWIDTYGYPVTFFMSFLMMALISGIWGFHQTNLFWLILFILFIHNGNNGVFSFMMRLAESTAAVKLVSTESSEFMMGFSALLSSVACFFGCAIAGQIYEWSGKDLGRYFEICAPGGILILFTAMVWLLIFQKKGNPRNPY